MNNRQLVNHISKRLRSKGVEVDVQPAISTNSFYLIFDGGVLKKARVGDHKGKGYHYTYEIGKHVKPPYEVTATYEGSTYTRYRYTAEQAEDLITQVLILRSNIRSKYGKELYESFKSVAMKTPKPTRKTSRARLQEPVRKTGAVGPKYSYRTPADYYDAIRASPEYAERQRREDEDQKRASAQMLEAMGPEFDPNGFSTY